MKFFFRKLLSRWGVPLAVGLVKLLYRTLRVTVEDPYGVRPIDPARCCVFAFWHNRILLMPLLYKEHLPGRRLTVMMSLSRDGQFMVGVARCFGIEAARGSTSRRSTGAQIQLAKLLEGNETDVAVTPDGPRGPCYHVHHGVLQLSQFSGRPIIPVTYELSSKWVFQSWDRFEVPKPFSHCRVRLGQPQQVLPGADFDVMAAALKRQLGE